MALTTAVCFLACNAGPAEHFATFAKHLEVDHEVTVVAAGPAIAKFNSTSSQVTCHYIGDSDFKEDGPYKVSQRIAKFSEGANITHMVVEAGCTWGDIFLKTLKENNPTVRRIVYYDNPENLVEGGYSKNFAKVARYAQEIWFANANLVNETVWEGRQTPINLNDKKVLGIGYYPIEKAEEIIDTRRAFKAQWRRDFLSRSGLVEKNQKIIAYFGGNNETYFNEAFPAFLKFYNDFLEKEDSDTIIFLQQHPGARKENKDAKLAQKLCPKLPISNFSTDGVLGFIYAGIYHQTSMGPVMALANIPLIQAGHETNPDLLIKKGLVPSATTPKSFRAALNHLDTRMKHPQDTATIKKALGLHDDWLDIMKRSLSEVHNKAAMDKSYKAKRLCVAAAAASLVIAATVAFWQIDKI